MATYQLYDIKSKSFKTFTNNEPTLVKPTKREQWRGSAKLSKAEFCIALKDAGLLSVAEAKLAAKGDWPNTFSAAITGPDKDDAEIVWAGVSSVERTHPILKKLQTFAKLTDERMDELFGYNG